MEETGLILSIIVGGSLGLIGSGGSILTIPILVYVFNIQPSIATTYSLFIVGISALIGSMTGIKSKLLDYKIALFFGIPSILSIFIMRKYIVDLIPNTLIDSFGIFISKDLLIMLVFAILMILASVSMIRQKGMINSNRTTNHVQIALQGTFVGLITGFVGVGGGFLIIPTLVYSAKLPMKKAVPTSLIIIAINALIGFTSSLNHHPIDWLFLLKFTTITIIGVMLGIYLNKKIANEKLKPIFGWFVLITGIYILIKEFVLLKRV